MHPRYTTSDFLKEKVHHPEECLFVVSPHNRCHRRCHHLRHQHHHHHRHRLYRHLHHHDALQVNKTYAFLSSSLTFWLPVLVMISLYYRFLFQAITFFYSGFYGIAFELFCSGYTKRRSAIWLQSGDPYSYRPIKFISI